MIPGGAPDEEVANLMEGLNDLQTWTVLLCTQNVPKAREAMDLVQRTRVLIVERLYPAAIAHKAGHNARPGVGNVGQQPTTGASEQSGAP
jgi:hypothetical protein